MHFLIKMGVFCSVFGLFQDCTLSKKSVPEPVERKLIWADEFETPGLPDSTKWSYDYGTGCPNLCGWGNNELEFYTLRRAENARVENGLLLIEAHREKWEGSNYTSARLVSKNKGDWTYGRIEARIKCPVGRGTWAAFWMLPTDWKYGGWPHSGEVDIMEHVGYEPNMVYSTAHSYAFTNSKGTENTRSIVLTDVATEFHVYAMEWRPDRVDFFVDDARYNTVLNPNKTHQEWPFDQRFHLILNLAVGGNWGGAKGVDETIWPQRMEVDYVRVYAY